MLKMPSSSYNNIHRQQLFHWIGIHIEEKANDHYLTDNLREEYVACLEDALENGLWAKVPRLPDQLGDGKLLKVRRPITCFTEWSLGQSLPHTQRYGRLALGFPKTFVFNRGGQPVTYVPDQAKGNPYVSALKAFAKFAATLDGMGVPSKEADEIRNHLDYLSHFAKRTKKPALPIIRKAPLPSGSSAKPKLSANVARRLKTMLDPYNRKYGTPLHYMEEREWRIVYDDSLKDWFETGPKSGTPSYYIPFKPGQELYTVVLPDNRTVNIALGREALREKVYPQNAPHVTILSLQDIGTF